MANINRKLTLVTAKLFDKRRRLLAQNDNGLYLLATDGRTSVFSTLKHFTTGYLSRTSRFRNSSILEIATIEDIRETIYETSHVGLYGQLYAVNKGEIVPPNDTRFTWEVTLTAKNEVFTP